jgi:hypothetical protein
MGKNMIVYAMSRNGHHAIINWIGKQLPYNVTFHNNCIHSIPSGEIKGTGHDVHYENGLEEAHIYSFENIDMDIVSSFGVPQMIDNPTNIIIVRDLLNWAASLTMQLKLEYLYIPYTEDGLPGFDIPIIEIYKTHLIEIAGITNILDNKTVIGYNQWCKDEQYRRDIADTLGMYFTDDGFLEVSTIGDGSSFDKNKFDGKANKMTTLDRYKYLSEHNMKYITKDKELMDLVKLTAHQMGPIPWL